MVYDTTRPESLDVLMYLKKDIDRNKDKKEVTIICHIVSDFKIIYLIESYYKFIIHFVLMNHYSVIRFYYHAAPCKYIE